MRFRFVIPVVAAIVVPAVMSAQVSINGQIGAEWAGVNPITVFYNAATPQGQFGSPTNSVDQTGYEIYMRRDANWLYTAFRTTNGQHGIAPLFANLYFSIRSGAGQYGTTGSSIGFEVANDRAFNPGFAPYYADNASNLIQFATSTNANEDIFESALSLSLFTGNPLGVGDGFSVPANPIGIRLNLSQTFGYGVAGGQTDYGDQRLGFVSLATVPEPSTYMLMAAGLLAVGMAARRRKNA